MNEPELQVTVDRLSKEVSNYAVGFVKLSHRERVELADSAGSGTLVTVGSVHGILTAAHVLDTLPREESVGIVLCCDRVDQFRHLVITIYDADVLTVRGERGIDGPDLGFLRLTEPDIGSLKALSSFYNLSKRREDVLANNKP